MSKSTIAVSFDNSWHNIEMSVQKMSIYTFLVHILQDSLSATLLYYIKPYRNVMLSNTNWYLHVNSLSYGFIWWSLNLNCAFLTKIETNLEVHTIKIISLAMGSEFSRKIHSSLRNHTRNSHKPGLSCNFNVFYVTEMIL